MGDDALGRSHGDADQTQVPTPLRRLQAVEDIVDHLLCEIRRLEDQRNAEAWAEDALRRALAHAPAPRLKRDRHGLHAVRAAAVPAVAWFTIRRAVVTGTAVALGAGATVAAPSIMAGPPPAAAAAREDSAPLIHQHPPRAAQAGALLPLAPVDARRARKRRRRRTATTSPAAPPPSPSPSPTGSDPVPLPTTTDVGTPPPTVSPSPS